MTARSTAIYAAALAAMLAGCSQDGSLTALNTGSVDPQVAAQKQSTDALCLTLASQIEALNTDGTSDKVAKAAAKKYKLKQTDLSKADELNKANTEFQTKCSSYPPKAPTTTAAVEPVSTEAIPGKTPATAKAKPPVPSQKPVAAALAPTDTSKTPSASATTTADIPASSPSPVATP